MIVQIAAVALAALFWLGAGAASADQIVQPQPFVLDLPDDESVTFDLFDPALGTLTGVELSLDSDLALGVEVTATGGPQDIGLATLFGDVNAEVGALSLSDPYALSAFCIPSTGSCSGFSSTVIAFDDSVTSSDPVDLASFTGSGSIMGDLGGFASLFSAGAATGASGDAEWSGTLTLIYTYEPAGTPVPGPGTLVLLGTGMVAIGGAARRRGRR